MLKNIKSHSKDINSLNEWLCYLETIHTTEIDLGLSRISEVAEILKIDLSFAYVITVAGTNGKGTTCAFIENAMLEETAVNKMGQLKNLNVAVYSSPHIEKFNERLRINKCDIDDQTLIAAFEQIELARGSISLSYYEFTTLAAFLILMKTQPDVIILEVGLGGRLDATNIIDANFAVITSVDIDHQAFLGNDRETIGFEKAGIMRSNQHIIIGDPNPPKSVLNYANTLNNINNINNKTENYSISTRNKDFSILNSTFKNGQRKLFWQWKYIDCKQEGETVKLLLNNLITPHIPQDNVATGLMVLNKLGLDLNNLKVNKLIEKTQVAGRTELFKSNYVDSKVSSNNKAKGNTIIRICDVMLDVGHNPHAGRYLSEKLSQLKEQNQYQSISAVVAMLADKDISNTLSPLHNIIDKWYVSSLSNSRAASPEIMLKELTPCNQPINCFDNITQAFKIANLEAKSTDLILVFGSFYTVAEVRQFLI